MTSALVQETTTNFVDAMATAANQVSVVTTNGKAGRFGITISAFASVSAEPPLVMVCINQRSPIVGAISINKQFCVNLLNDNQPSIANCFAGRSNPEENYNFECANWDYGKTQSPVLIDAAANFDCVLNTSYNAGTHCIIIGKVVHALASTCTPLVFSDRQYQSLQTLSI